MVKLKMVREHSSFMIKKITYQNTHYLTSAVDLPGLPDDSGAEVAFIGRSNAGKSSSINTITNIKGLARTSKTPGRTQMINFFEIDAARRLVDLPGYGYAKVPKPLQIRWTENINAYLQSRRSLRGLVVVMDIRHPLMPQDWQIIEWTHQCDIPVHVLLTKADKLTRQAMIKMQREVTDQLERVPGVKCSVFSSLNRLGLDEIHEVLEAWLSN